MNSWRPNELPRKAEDVAKKNKSGTGTSRTSDKGSEVNEVSAATEVVGEAGMVVAETLADVVISTDALRDTLDPLLAVVYHLHRQLDLLIPTYPPPIGGETSDVES